MTPFVGGRVEALGNVEVSVPAAWEEECCLQGGFLIQGCLEVAVYCVHLGKEFADAGMVCRISETQAKGWSGCLTNEFSLVKSVTILTFFPSALTTKNAGEHHSVGVWHRVMTFLASSS